MSDAANMDDLSKRRLESQIIESLASGSLAYEQALKTRRESFWYPVVVAGGLMGGGAAIAVAVARFVGGV